MSLYRNINKRRKAGTSRTKKKSTISDKATLTWKLDLKRKRKGEVKMPRGKGTYKKPGRPKKKKG